MDSSILDFDGEPQSLGPEDTLVEWKATKHCLRPVVQFTSISIFSSLFLVFYLTLYTGFILSNLQIINNINNYKIFAYVIDLISQVTNKNRY